MTIGSELEKLNQLHKDGVLSDSEFASAKSKLLGSLGPENTVGSGTHLIGKAANKFVNFTIIYVAVGAVIFGIVFFTFFLPRFEKMEIEHDKFSEQIDADMQKSRERLDKMTKDFDKSYDETSKSIDKTRRQIEEAHKKSGFQ